MAKILFFSAMLLGATACQAGRHVMMIQVHLVGAVREAGSLAVLGSVVHPDLSL